MFGPWHAKRGFWFATLAGTGVVVLCSSLLYITVKRPAPVNLPAENEITVLRASGTDWWERAGLPPVPEFTVPSKYIPIILKAFSPVKHPEDPTTWDDQVVARLLLTTNTGRFYRINVRDSGQNPICFTLDGVRCVRGGGYHPLDGENGMGADESMLLYLMLRGIYEEATTGKTPSELRHWIEYLQISRGERTLHQPQGEND